MNRGHTLLGIVWIGMIGALPLQGMNSVLDELKNSYQKALSHLSCGKPTGSYMKRSAS